jgi:Trypsin
MAFCCLLVLDERARGLVGGAQLATDDFARSVVGIVGPRSSFCTATAIANDLLLTAGHCLRPDADYKVQYKDTRGLRQSTEIIDRERPPQFNQVMTTIGVTADLALLKLANPLPANIGLGMLGLHQPPIWPGDRFTVIGGGIGLRGLHDTGTNRAAILVATSPYSELQIRLIDSSGQRVTMGACYGDSGSPVFQTQTDGTKVIGVVSWATGPNRTKGCGGITGATLLSPYRQWIEETVSKLGRGPG